MTRRKQKSKIEDQPDESGIIEEGRDSSDDVDLELNDSAVEEPMSDDERIRALEAELEDAKGRYFRVLADYQNFQRRSAQNEILAAERAKQDLVRELIPVLDNFELAIEHGASEAEGASEQILKGVCMVRDVLAQVLAQKGLYRVFPKGGDEFDPNRHEAMMMEPTEDVETNHVVRTIQVGYGMGETILRPAKVIIAQSVSSRQEEGQHEVSRGDDEVDVNEEA